MQPAFDIANRGRRAAARVRTLRRRVLRLAAVWTGVVVLATPVFGEPAIGKLKAHRWDRNEVLRQPDGDRLLQRELDRRDEYMRRWHMVHELVGPGHVSHISKERLAAQGLGPALGKAAPRDMSKALEPDVLRVLLVRVGFAANRDSHLTTISPGGDFMLDPLADPGPLEIDPPPHDKAYFEAHLAGLSEYYRVMSGGRLQIEGTVLPAGDTDSYKLSDVADYGPGAGNFWDLEGLESLVRDMIAVTDQGMIADGLGAGLADYDDETPFTYVIFVHSGSDWQSDILGDSPNDIPTFFVNLGEPSTLQGTNPQGNPGLLSECSIIPETTNQDGYPGSIAAAFYHEFGHALGLPDVYNTATGLPAVGVWDLMDSGTNLPVNIGREIVTDGDTTRVFYSATGVLPPSLSPWCRQYLGWLDVAELDAPISSSGYYVLPAVSVPLDEYPDYFPLNPEFKSEYPQAYRAGLSPDEYFLIENRFVPGFNDPLPFSELYFKADPGGTGVVLYLAGVINGVERNSGLYDYFMPGGGLVVWHVNQARIAETLDDNEINIHGDGLRLVEADGIQDVGVLDAYVRGWQGSWRDPFGGYDLDGVATGYNDLYVDAFPSSRMFDRSYSGLRLSEMGPRLEGSTAVMAFKASLEPVRKGFPWETAPLDTLLAGIAGGTVGPRAVDPRSLMPLYHTGEPLLVFADRGGEAWDGGDFPAMLYALRPNGAPRWAATGILPDGAVLSLGAPLVGPPTVLDRPDNTKLVLTGQADGRVMAVRLAVVDAPAPIWTASLADSALCAPRLVTAADGGQGLLAAAGDSLFLLDPLTGARRGPAAALTPSGAAGPRRLVVVPFGDGVADRAVLLTADGWHLIDQDGTGLTGVAYRTWDDALPDAALHHSVRPRGDGDVEFTVYGASGVAASAVLGPAGSPVAGGAFPDLDGPLVADPAVADVDGDGRHDLVLATATRIYGFKERNVPLRGFPVRFADLFPVADTTRVTGPLLVADGDGDGAADIFFNTDGGHLFGLEATGRLNPGFPVRWGDRTDAGFAIGTTPSTRILWLASSGGYRTGFRDRQGVGGRVAAWDLTAAAATGARSSEWLGPEGGTARRGVVGDAQTLGSAAPVAVEIDRAFLYPNPLRGDDVRARFYSSGGRDARVALYNLEGELVAEKRATVQAAAVNEVTLAVPGIASGMYIARLEYDGPGGREVRTLTLAVEK